ncbi:MAG: ATP synthase subunit I [bacterium]
MNNVLQIAFVLVSGVASGLFYFGGLRFTVRKAVFSKKPNVWIFGSFIIRLGILIIIFRLFANLGLSRLLLLLAGLILGRIIITRIPWDKEKSGVSSVLGADNALES